MKRACPHPALGLFCLPALRAAKELRAAGAVEQMVACLARRKEIRAELKAWRCPARRCGPGRLLWPRECVAPPLAVAPPRTAHAPPHGGDAECARR